MNQMLDLLRQRAELAPSEPIFEGPEGSISAVELLARLQEISLELRASNAFTVALLADNSPDWALVDLACQLEGISLVPVPTFFSNSQIKHLLESAGVELVIYQKALPLKLAGVPEMETLKFESLAGDFAVARRQSPPSAQVPPGTSKITFTSGSTGEPKGVCLSFEQCLAVAESLGEAIGVERPRHLCVLPLSTLLENIGGVYLPLLAGGSSVILPPEELGMQGSSGLEANTFLDALERCQPNTLILVPQLLAVLDEALAKGWRAPESLRFVAVGGARVSPCVVERVRARGLPVYEGYGLSECASVVSLNRPGADCKGSSGKVLPHVNVVSLGGELVVDGNTFLGYLNQPKSWHAPRVATGDIGSIDAGGFLRVAGRSKNLIITSFGRNISPEWVESEVLAGNEFLQAVVVGDGRPSCAALLHPRDPDISNREIQDAVNRANQNLPDYARIGTWLRLDSPLSVAGGLLTENGRPRRGRIADRYAVAINQLYNKTREFLAS